jgi:20S proteasome subunit beta 6
MGANATAQMLSTILYGKRFFPYSVWNVLGGLDDKGVGAVYSYDPVGNFRRCNFKVILHIYNSYQGGWK